MLIISKLHANSVLKHSVADLIGVLLIKTIAGKYYLYETAENMCGLSGNCGSDFYAKCPLQACSLYAPFHLHAYQVTASTSIYARGFPRND